ncbi:MAG: hypothetical protein RL264_1805 [Bacteroidota bacterium]|jgi:hypothetical protein
MDIHTKNIILQNCNTQTIESLIRIIKSNSITLEEFKEAGLHDSKVEAILNSIISATIKTEKKSEKEKFLQLVIDEKIDSDEIINKIENKILNIEDLESLINIGKFTLKTFKAIKYKIANKTATTPFREVTELPPMQAGRTDLYFIGVPRSGKSTMLTGILNCGVNNGILMPDTSHQVGVNFQNKLLQDFRNGVIPLPTADGSYNYISMSLKGPDGKKHPFNVVDVPGEVFNKIVENPKVDDFLTYIHNSNKKIFVFVIDSLTHDNEYSEGLDQNDQSLIYPNILQLLNENRVLENVDAIYLVANKFDAIKNKRYSTDERNDVDLAEEFLREKFLYLINNCIDTRDELKNKFKIRILPFSIGKVSYKTIVEEFNEKYSKNLINDILSDSFVIKSNKWIKFFSQS